MRPPTASTELGSRLAAEANALRRLRHLAAGRLHYRHPVNVALHDQAGGGDRLADGMAGVIGSWRFLVIQSSILGAWIVANVVLAVSQAVARAWDPYPFILLNLCLSFQAAYTGPILLIAANRQAQKDRLTLEHTAEEADRADAQNEAILGEIDRNTTLTLQILRHLGLTTGDETTDSPAEPVSPPGSASPPTSSGDSPPAASA